MKGVLKVSKEQVIEVERYCDEHGITRSLLSEDEIHGGQFLPIMSGTGLVPAASMPTARSRKKSASVQTEPTTIEVRTSSGAEMRLMGNFSAETVFFYVNPLESEGGHHRQPWYGCACCPSQICRFLPSIGNYIYGKSADAVYVNMFIGSEGAGLKMETLYPYDGRIAITLTEALQGEVRNRIPHWCRDYSVNLGKRAHSWRICKGYLCLAAKWKKGDRIELNFEMPVRLEQSDPRVLGNVGKRAVCRGPLVYCMEETDNAGLYDTGLDPDTEFEICTPSAEDDPLLGAVRIRDSRGHSFIPYFCWDNREPCRMKVWVNYTGIPSAAPQCQN